MDDTEAFNAYLETLPATAFLVVMAAHLGQAFFGGWTAARLGKSRPVMLAMIIGVLSPVGCIGHLMSIDTPARLMIALPLYPPP